jgi:hypothetical protein
LVNNSFTALSCHLGPGCRPWRSGPQGAAPARGWSKLIFDRKLDGGAARIAAILGERGVVVR